MNCLRYVPRWDSNPNQQNMRRFKASTKAIRNEITKYCPNPQPSELLKSFSVKVDDHFFLVLKGL